MLADPVLRREVVPRRRKRLWVSVVSGFLCVLFASLVGATIAVAARSHAVLDLSLRPLRPHVSRCSVVDLRATVSRAAFDAWLTGSAIRRGSSLALIGLKHGDVIQRVQGIDAGREIRVDLLRRICPSL